MRDGAEAPGAPDDPILQARLLRAVAEASRIEAEEARSIARAETEHSAQVCDRARNLRQFLLFVRARREQRTKTSEDGHSLLPPHHAPGDGPRPEAR